MLSSLAARLFRRASIGFVPATTVTASRTAICPPAVFEDTEPQGLQWLRRLAGRAEAAETDPIERLRTVRAEFAETLDDVPTQHASFLQHRVRCARSMRELWHMRSEIFHLVAVQYSQDEAERRMAALNRFFPTRSPRSGFVPL